MVYIPCTTFEGDTEEAKWNGWQNGPGASKGELKSEGNNGYWSGQVNLFNMPKIQPALHKVLDIEPGTYVDFHFNYRIPSAPSEFFYITITDPDRQGMNHIPVETTTPVGIWLETQTEQIFMWPRKEVWIGFSGSRLLSPFLIEFDNICFEPRI